MKAAWTRRKASVNGSLPDYEVVREKLEARKNELANEIKSIDSILERVTPETINALNELKKLGY